MIKGTLTERKKFLLEFLRQNSSNEHVNEHVRKELAKIKKREDSLKKAREKLEAIQAEESRVRLLQEKAITAQYGKVKPHKNGYETEDGTIVNPGMYIVPPGSDKAILISHEII